MENLVEVQALVPALPLTFGSACDA
jgi:hypothetical protein